MEARSAFSLGDGWFFSDLSEGVLVRVLWEKS